MEEVEEAIEVPDWVAQFEDLMAGDDEPSDGESLSSIEEDESSSDSSYTPRDNDDSTSKRILRPSLPVRIKPAAKRAKITAAAVAVRVEKKFQPAFLQKWK